MSGAGRIAMMAMTTSSSRSVKARRFCRPSFCRARFPPPARFASQPNAQVFGNNGFGIAGRLFANGAGRWRRRRCRARRRRSAAGHAVSSATSSSGKARFKPFRPIRRVQSSPARTNPVARAAHQFSLAGKTVPRTDGEAVVTAVNPVPMAGRSSTGMAPFSSIVR